MTERSISAIERDLKAAEARTLDLRRELERAYLRGVNIQIGQRVRIRADHSTSGKQETYVVARVNAWVRPGKAALEGHRIRRDGKAEERRRWIGTSEQVELVNE